MTKTFKLNNNKHISSLGLGTWNAKKDKVGNAVTFAIEEAGFRHIDCASIYGNQIQIGQALSNIQKNGKVKRKQLFITSKLWNTDHSSKNVITACKKTLKDLQLDYLDLYLVHWGVSFQDGKSLEPLDKNGLAMFKQVPMYETWKAMEKLVAKGLVRSIGVANFTAPMLIDLLSYATIKPAINQIELHPYNTQSSLVSFCKNKKIGLTAYSPLGSPGGIGKGEPKLLLDPVIKAVANAHNKSPAQVLIKWSLQRGVSVIPKSTNNKRIAENISVDDFSLNKSEMEKINKLNRNYRFVNPVDWWGFPYFD